MTAAFGFLLTGWLLLASATRNQPVTDILRGALTTGGPGPGERGFTRSILRELSGALPASGKLPELDKRMVTMDGKQVCGWIATELRAARRNGWGGRVVSGHRSVAEQRQACIGVCGNPNGCSGPGGACAKPGESNHQGTDWPGCAVDVSDPEGLARALPRGSRLKWTGRTIGDTPHFSSGRRGV